MQVAHLVEKGYGSHFRRTETEKTWFMESFGLREEWYQYLIDLEHIQFEKLDDKHAFGRMMVLLQDGERGRFLLWHMMAANFEWNIVNHPPFRSKYATK